MTVTIGRRELLAAFGSVAAAWPLVVRAQQPAIQSGNHDDSDESHDQPTRTAKERLGVKASDEQRVDNCKVPRDRRGPTAVGRMRGRCEHEDPQMTIEREREHLAQVGQI